MSRDQQKNGNEILIQRNVKVPMRDGVELSADIYLPNSDDPAPAVLKYYPYRKDDILRPLVEPRVRYFASRGYVGILLDVRGTGGSGGSTKQMLRMQEWEDGYDAVEWIAVQPWCDGNVGMTGVSYGGYSAQLTAAQAPPHLKAIVPIYCGADQYQNGRPGGNLQTSIWTGLYSVMMTALNAAPPREDSDGEWVEIWKMHLEENSPWLLPWLEDSYDGSRWREGSVIHQLEGIQCPTYIIAGWHDIFVSDPFDFFKGIPNGVDKKLLVGPYLHIAPWIGTPGPRIDHLHETIRWFDHYLRGEDTGIADEPPVTIWVRGFDLPDATRRTASGNWRNESSWPIDRAEPTNFYFQSEGDLTRSMEESGQSIEFDYDPTVGATTMGLLTGFGSDLGLPIDQRADEMKSVVFTSPSMTKDMEVTGVADVVLFFSSTASVTMFSVKLIDVSPNDTSALVTRGVLNATHRNSHVTPEALVPGEVYELNIALEPCSYIFAKGHRIRISIASADFPLLWPMPQQARNTIYVDSSRPSRVCLPFIPASEDSVVTPHFRDPPDVPSLPSWPEPTSWDATRDLLTGALTVKVSFGGETKFPDEDLSISTYAEMEISSAPEKPAETSLESRFTLILSRSNFETEIKSNAIVKSDGHTFYAVTSLDVKVDDVHYFKNSWPINVKRGLL